MKIRIGAVLASIIAVSTAGAAHAGNPAFPGWYAGPQLRAFGYHQWIYPTYSDDAGKPDAGRRKRADPSREMMGSPPGRSFAGTQTLPFRLEERIA